MNTLTIQLQTEHEKPLPPEALKDLQEAVNRFRAVLGAFGYTRSGMYINGQLYDEP